jgi:hypothetical protein
MYNGLDYNFFNMIKKESIEEIIRFYENTSKKVLTFVGYSGAEYEDKTAMLKIAGQVLDEVSPSTTIINIGATPHGIGAIYELAHRRGFTTSGIVSTQAKEYNVELSHYVDIAYYVEDFTWGGFIAGSNNLSPTSRVMVEISDLIIGIGGGEIGRDELIAAKRSGKEIRFFRADMNHQIAKEKTQTKGLPEPTNFGGAAGEVFGSK